jgi:tRNA G26 N,N-dimethylase Trm1
MAKPKRYILTCGVCGGNHHMLECDAELAAFPAFNIKCEKCGERVEFTGPFCVACTIDRAVARALGIEET